MAKVLLISIPNGRSSNQNPYFLFRALDLGISKNVELYQTKRIHEITRLLEMNEFAAILIFSIQQEALLPPGHLHSQFSLFIDNGGTIIFISGCFQHPDPVKRIRTKTNLGLDWTLGPCQAMMYKLNEQSELVLRKGLIAKLDPYVSTYRNVVKDIPEHAKIYTFPDDTTCCSAAFLERGAGFIGYIGYDGHECTCHVLAVAMIEHAIEANSSAATIATPEFTVQTSETPTISYLRSPEQLPILLDMNAGCVVCRVLAPAKTCSKCHSAQYCSTACQKFDWPCHKQMCFTREETSPVAEMSRKNTPVASEWSG